MYDREGKHRGVRQIGNQEVDIVSVVKPLTKYAVTVDDPNSIRYHLEKAVYLARCGRPGPVWVDIPIDVQGAPIDETALPGFLPEAAAAFPSDSLEEQVSKLIERLNGSERPLLMIGNGVRLAGAEALLQETLRLLGVPVATTWVAMDLIGNDDPLFVGRPGTVASRGANFTLQNCDFLLAIGARMDLAIVGYAPENMARGAWKAMVDVDAAELAKMGKAVQMPLCVDAKRFLAELLRQRERIARCDRSGWIRRCGNRAIPWSPKTTAVPKAGLAFTTSRKSSLLKPEPTIVS
jgi:acetolactate synthase-1/2/3 large subunit